MSSATAAVCLNQHASAAHAPAASSITTRFFGIWSARTQNSTAAVSGSSSSISTLAVKPCTEGAALTIANVKAATSAAIGPRSRWARNVTSASVPRFQMARNRWMPKAVAGNTESASA